MSQKASIVNGTGQTEWIGRQEIRRIEGALKPSAYVARAYKHTQERKGAVPEWAMKQDNGRWLFRTDYVLADAELNRESLSVNEAASILDVTRRAIQTWVDGGEIAVSGDGLRTKGEQRRIARKQFLEDLPRLRKRLETPAVIGYRMKHGKPLPVHIADRAVEDRRTTQPEAPSRTPTPKQSIASILEARLKHAVQSRKGAKDTTGIGRPGSASKAEKEQVAAAIEARLREAKEAKLQQQIWTHEAEVIAERIMNDMFDNELSRIGAVVLFNKVAAKKNIPDDIRIKARKKFFGK